MQQRIMYLAIIIAIHIGFTVSQKMCSQEEAEKCFEGSTGLSSIGQPFNIQDPETNCRTTYQEAKTCLQEVLASCGTSTADSIVALAIGPGINVVEFLCSEKGLREYKKHGSCLDSYSVVQKIGSCNQMFSEAASRISNPGEFCREVHALRVCYARGVNSSCGLDAVNFVDKWITFSLESVIAVSVPSCNLQDPLSKYCFPSPCKNGGECSSPSGQAVCSCPPGSEGAYCERSTTSASDCLTTGCLNKGHCVVSMPQYVCLCDSQYTGPKCETMIQPSTDANSSGQPSVGLSTVAIVGIVVGIIVALLLGLCMTFLLICKLRKPKPSTETSLELNSGDPGPPNPPKILDERPPPTAPDIVTQSVPPRPPPRMENVQTHSPNMLKDAPNALNYLKVHDPANTQGQYSAMPGYSDVRNMEEVMKAVWSTQFPNTSTEGQSFPFSPTSTTYPIDTGYSGPQP